MRLVHERCVCCCACRIKAGRTGGECGLPGAAAAGSGVALEAGLEHAALVAALAAHSSRRVLKLTDLRQLPGALPAGKDRDRRVLPALRHTRHTHDRIAVSMVRAP